MVRRNRRAGVEDRWYKTIRDEQRNILKVPSARHGQGLRWMARYVDDNGNEQTKAFGRKADAQTWLNRQVSDQVTGTWTDPALSGVTFGVLAERWLSTKATRSPKTVAGYRSLLDTVVLPRWKEVPLRDIRFDDLQVWITGLTVNGSVRFEGKGLSASRVRQAHQLIGAVLKFAVKAKHLAANPADGHMVSRLRVAIAGWMASVTFCLGLVALAPPATADEDQFLSHLLTGNMAHPSLTPPALVKMGHQACSDIAGGVSPDFEKDKLDTSLSNQGVAASRAEVGTLIHFVLRDLCPNVPNTTGI